MSTSSQNFLYISPRSGWFGSVWILLSTLSQSLIGMGYIPALRFAMMAFASQKSRMARAWRRTAFSSGELKRVFEILSLPSFGILKSGAALMADCLTFLLLPGVWIVRLSTMHLFKMSLGGAVTGCPVSWSITGAIGNGERSMVAGLLWLLTTWFVSSDIGCPFVGRGVKKRRRRLPAPRQRRPGCVGWLETLQEGVDDLPLFCERLLAEREHAAVHPGAQEDVCPEAFVFGRQVQQRSRVNTPFPCRRRFNRRGSGYGAGAERLPQSNQLISVLPLHGPVVVVDNDILAHDPLSFLLGLLGLFRHLIHLRSLDVFRRDAKASGETFGAFEAVRTRYALHCYGDGPIVVMLDANLFHASSSFLLGLCWGLSSEEAHHLAFDGRSEERRVGKECRSR